MIDEQLPKVDTLEGHDGVERELRRDSQRRRILIFAVAGAVLAAAVGAVLLNRGGDGPPQPAKQLPNRVMMLDETGGVSFVARDGSWRTIPANHVERFALSPDGTKVALIGDGPRGSHRRLWIVDTDGSNRRLIPLCHRCIPGWGLDWSHDGTRLAFVTSRPGEPTWQIRVRSLVTGAEVEFDRRGVLGDVAFSPDDEQLALTVGSQDPVVATMDIGDGLASLRPVSPTHRAVQAPTWSADGKTIYYTASDAELDPPRDDTDTALDLLRVNDVYALDVGTREERQITHAATGERYYVVHLYGVGFLTTHAVSKGDMVIGWMSQDGSSFKPIHDADGQPVVGLSAELQP